MTAVGSILGDAFEDLLEVFGDGIDVLVAR